MAGGEKVSSKHPETQTGSTSMAHKTYRVEKLVIYRHVNFVSLSMTTFDDKRIAKLNSLETLTPDKIGVQPWQ